jgi:hypothetical protein
LVDAYLKQWQQNTWLHEQQEELAKAHATISEKSKVMEDVESKLRVANDRIQRTDTLKELLAPLSRDKKTVMEDLLKDIKTANLKEAFARYLPAVVNGTQASQTKVTLAETNQPKSVAVTGDRTNQLAKAVIEETKTSDDLGMILHLAGIKN